MDNLLQMSTKELSRLEVMQRLTQQRMSQKEAGRILNLSTRQIKRLLKAFRERGAAGLVSKHRGRQANNRLSEEVKRKALNLLKTGVDPLWWTVVGLGKGAQKCLKVMRPIRRRTANKSWN